MLACCDLDGVIWRGDEAIAGYRKALAAARDVDQIKAVDAALKGLGQSVDLPRQFGFLMHWQVIGPFDNAEGRGFDAVYPPEQAVDLAAQVAGRDGPVSWKPLATTDAYGMVDLNPSYPGPEGGLKEVVAYAFTAYDAAEGRDAELRLGCKNAWKLWHNGRLLFGRDEYHRGMKIDQYRLPIRLERGRNTILVKLCQDAQKQGCQRQDQQNGRDRGHRGPGSAHASSPSSPPRLWGSRSSKVSFRTVRAASWRRVWSSRSYSWRSRSPVSVISSRACW